MVREVLQEAATLDEVEATVQAASRPHVLPEDGTDPGVFDFLDDLVLACPAEVFVDSFRHLRDRMAAETGYAVEYPKLQIWRPAGQAEWYLPAELT